MITNAGIVAGVIVALALLLAGILLWRRVPSSGGPLLSLGALIMLGAEVYGLGVLRPFIGRPYDDQWYQQISTVESAATLGLLIAAAGVVAHALRLPKR